MPNLAYVDHRALGLPAFREGGRSTRPGGVPVPYPHAPNRPPRDSDGGTA
jgi:hypothetical protein